MAAEQQPAQPQRVAQFGGFIQSGVAAVRPRRCLDLGDPAYTDSVLKGRRAEGRTALINLLQQQERYLTQTGCYLTFTAGATGANGTNCAGGGQNIPFQTRSGTGNAAYTLAAAVCTGASGALARNECVLLTAVPGAADPKAGTLSLLSTGAKSCDGTNPSVCWK